MAQMAPALAEAAGSPSPNCNISSSSVQKPLRNSYIEEETTIDKPKVQCNSTTSNHNGFCRSMANSINVNATAGKAVKRVLDEVHKLNNLPRAFQGPLESTKSSMVNSQSASLASCGENTSLSNETRPISSQKETLVSTPTRIPITTTKTCGSNSLENRSSCQASDNKTNVESQQRHLFPCPEPSPRVLYEKRVKKVGLNQIRLAARARKLERKLRTLQSRQLESHVTEQLQTFALNRKKAQQGFSHPKHEQSKQDLTLRQASTIKLKEEGSSETPLKPFGRVGEETTSDASSLQKNDNKQSGVLENNRRTDCGSVSKRSGNESEGNAARSLVCHLELAEHVADSDATESSSGAESADEMDYTTASSESKAKGVTSPLNQFYTERGSIASKWTWLRSQVIDIERRIRRCEETYKAVRGKKMPIHLEKQRHTVENNVLVSVANKSASDLLADTLNVSNNRKIHPDLCSDIMASPITPKKDNSGIPLLTEKDKTNLLLNAQKCSIQHDSDHVNSCTAARTRCVQQWRKRKLFNLTQVQRPSKSMVCTCGDLCTPCVLCKRISPNLPRMLQQQDLRDRVSLIDLSFHPVLSFEAEIPLSLHFGALLKKGNFQSKIFKLNPPNDTKPATKRKYVRSTSSPAAIKKKERKEALELSYKKQGIRNLRDRKNRKKAAKAASKNERTLRQKSRANAKRSAALNAGLRLANQLQKRARSLSLPSGNGSRPSSPVSNTPSPTSFGHSFPAGALSAKKKKTTSNAFDINNIVIPYSMASTTRVEKLQYKEILTPAWREVTVTPNEQIPEEVKMEEDEEREDLSNLSFALRHLKCEENERKRFIGLAIKKKKRSTRLNSEATTPEPVSPGSLLFDGHLTAGQNSSGVPSPTSSNPSLNSSLNVTSPTGLTGAVVNMISSDSMSAKLERSGKSSRHHSARRSSSMDCNEDSNEAWPVLTPWPLRSFPLSETEVEHLHNPPPTPRVLSVPPSPASSRTASPILSPVDSPDNTATANWTVKVLSPEAANNTDSDSKPPRKGIVLKLAKR